MSSLESDSLSCTVRQVGHAILSVKLPDNTVEDYLITLPSLAIGGFFIGRPSTELTDRSLIVSSSGWVSSIQYMDKKLLDHKAHRFEAQVTGAGSSNAVHTINGFWHQSSKTNKGIHLCRLS